MLLTLYEAPNRCHLLLCVQQGTQSLALQHTLWQSQTTQQDLTISPISQRAPLSLLVIHLQLLVGNLPHALHTQQSEPAEQSAPHNSFSGHGRSVCAIAFHSRQAAPR